MKIMLLFPPQFDVSMPALGLPCLTAVLQKAGHTVVQKDINIETYEHFLSKTFLEKAYKNVYINRKNLLFCGADVNLINELLKTGPSLIENVENAKAVLRSSEDFYNFDKYKNSIRVLRSSLKLISMANYPNQLTFHNFKTEYSTASTSQIMEAVLDEEGNLYSEFYKEHALPQIIEKAPKVIGISITAHTQVIPGLTLAHVIKENMNNVHIVIGGSFFTHLEKSLIENHALFSLFDSVIINEGEKAFKELVNCLENNKPLDSVPNLIYKDGNNIIANNTAHIEDIDTLPTPSFDFLPMHLYFSPETVLPVYSSRGCYFGRCAFCSFHLASGKSYRSRDEALVIKDMQQLKDKYGAKVFVFMDEAITPNSLSKIADEIIENELQVKWSSHARFEKQIDYELCKKLYKSGCTSLGFGLESANSRVSGLMDKGNVIEVTKAVLIASFNAGIANHVTFFFGFPTETPGEALETALFIAENSNLINSIKFDHFSLMKNSRVFCNPGSFGVKSISYKEDMDLALLFDYCTESGMDQASADEITNLFAPPLINLFEYLKYFINCHNVLYPVFYKSNRIMDFIDRSKGIDKEFHCHYESCKTAAIAELNSAYTFFIRQNAVID